MKISIITATYNSGATLRDTMESVLAQTHHDFEHIIIDGGSTDDTLDIIHEYEPRYAGLLKWISEPDGGIYDAMNKGIRMASGDVVGILNSDDFYTSNDILALIADNISDVDAVYADVHYVSSENLRKTVRRYSSAGFRPWKMRLGFMPAHPSFYCHRQLYNKYGLFNTELKVASDFELLLRFIFIHHITTKYIHRDFVTMRTGGTSTSGLCSHKQIYHDHMAAYKLNGVYSNTLFESVRYICKIGEMIETRLCTASYPPR